MWEVESDWSTREASPGLIVFYFLSWVIRFIGVHFSIYFIIFWIFFLCLKHVIKTIRTKKIKASFLHLHMAVD